MAYKRVYSDDVKKWAVTTGKIGIPLGDGRVQ